VWRHGTSGGEWSRCKRNLFVMVRLVPRSGACRDEMTRIMLERVTLGGVNVISVSE
jgi:hypothetical protein